MLPSVGKSFKAYALTTGNIWIYGLWEDLSLADVMDVAHRNGFYLRNTLTTGLAALGDQERFAETLKEDSVSVQKPSRLLGNWVDLAWALWFLMATLSIKKQQRELSRAFK